MRRRPHSHKCIDCGAAVECCGEILQNYDGFPEWYCDEFERWRHVWRCEECHTAEEDRAAADLVENLEDAPRRI